VVVQVQPGVDTSSTDERTARLSSRAVLLAFGVSAALLNMANVISIACGADTDRTEYFLLAHERNPSTWLAAAVLASAAVLAWLVGRGRRDARTWSFVAALFAAMSLDEVATFHERMAALPLPGIGSRGWAGAGLLLVVVVGVRLVRWVLGLDIDLRVAMIAGGALFVAGAVGLEVLAGNHQSVHGEDTWFWVLSTVEENLELLGVVVVVRALLGHLARRPGTLAVRVTA
jgi:hypothetical protein